MVYDLGLTLTEALLRLRVDCAAAGVDDAPGDARRLLAAAINAPTSELIVNPTRVLTHDETARLDAYANRRIAREPVTRILGEREFYGRPFKVTPAVLDPRADTETLIDAALSLARRLGWDHRPIAILDIGTGSGAIIATLLAELPLATGLAIDISHAALAVACANAESLGVSGRARFEQRDIFAGLPCGYDLIVSNPPYIPTIDLEALDPEVIRHDPHIALDGGSDGLIFYRTIINAWSEDIGSRATNCALVLELGAEQAKDVTQIAQTALGPLASRTSLSTHRDLGGHVRCLTLQSRSVG